jgi:AsmA protein
MQKAAALANGKIPPTGRGTGRTEFQRLDADGRISDSTLRNRNFRFVSDFFKVKGAGDVHYDDGRLDLKFEARLTQAPEGSVQGFDLDRLVGGEIPVAVGGTLTEPEVGIDPAKLIESAATKAIEKKLDELIDVEEVKEKLKGLFGR